MCAVSIMGWASYKMILSAAFLLNGTCLILFGYC